jgi:hypothetical protein
MPGEFRRRGGTTRSVEDGIPTETVGTSSETSCQSWEAYGIRLKTCNLTNSGSEAVAGQLAGPGCRWGEWPGCFQVSKGRTLVPKRGISSADRGSEGYGAVVTMSEGAPGREPAGFPASGRGRGHSLFRK